MNYQELQGQYQDLFIRSRNVYPQTKALLSTPEIPELIDVLIEKIKRFRQEEFQYISRELKRNGKIKHKEGVYIILYEEPYDKEKESRSEIYEVIARGDSERARLYGPRVWEVFGELVSGAIKIARDLGEEGRLNDLSKYLRHELLELLQLRLIVPDYRALRKPNDLSETQFRVLRYIVQHIGENGYPPTDREIAAALGYRSNQTAYYHLSELKKAGYINLAKSSKKTRKMRRIVITEKVFELLE